METWRCGQRGFKRIRATTTHDFAPFHQNLLRDSATQGTEMAAITALKAGHR
jgi:hypothetical protein